MKALDRKRWTCSIRKMIHDVADLYQLQSQDIARLERLGEKSAENIMAGLARSREVPYERVLFAWEYAS